MILDQESIIHSDHIEQVQFFEDPHRISPYMTDTYFHIISSIIINPYNNEHPRISE
jgi:hypothetical protein